MKYDNTTYWQNIHNKHGYSLKSVGHPFLSESLNRLKYQSETDTMLQCLMTVANGFKQVQKSELSVLDVGAGTGYWSDIVQSYFSAQDFSLNMTALDISPKALSDLKKRNPHIKVVQKDLKSIQLEIFMQSFDLIITSYCLHHFINLDDFTNALRFVGKSVKNNGYLIIMDPILTMPYSLFDVMEFSSFKGNGIPRHLYIIDDILAKEGLHRNVFRPAVSFLLNGNIESQSHITYTLTTMIWRSLCFFYKSDRFVKSISKLLLTCDKFLKKRKLSFSLSISVYKK
jgi:SAM-dependent methyltransferase